MSHHDLVLEKQALKSVQMEDMGKLWRTTVSSSRILHCLFDLALQQIKYSGALTLLNANSDLHEQPLLVFWTREFLFLCHDSGAMEDPTAYPR